MHVGSETRRVAAPELGKARARASVELSFGSTDVRWSSPEHVVGRSQAQVFPDGVGVHALRQLGCCRCSDGQVASGSRNGRRAELNQSRAHAAWRRSFVVQPVQRVVGGGRRGG